MERNDILDCVVNARSKAGQLNPVQTVVPGFVPQITQTVQTQPPGGAKNVEPGQAAPVTEQSLSAILLLMQQQMHLQQQQADRHAELQAEQIQLQREQQAEQMQLQREQNAKLLQQLATKHESEQNFLTEQLQFAKDQAKQADVDKNKFENRLAKANKIVKNLFYTIPQVSNLVPAWLSKIRQIFEKNKIDADLQVTLITPYLTGRVREILQHLLETDLVSFDALAERLKVEYGLTPAVNKFNFDNATRASEETFTQFCSRLTNLLATYLASKKVQNYDQLCQLLIVDRLKSILPLAAKMFLVNKEIDGENLT